MNDFRTDVEVNLKGDLENKAKASGQAFDRFSNNASRSLARLSRTTVGLSNGIDRLGNKYSGLVTAAGITFAARGVVSFEKALKDIQVQAGMTDDEIRTLRQTILDTAQASDVRVDPTEILAAIDAVIEKTGDVKLATENIRNMGIAMRATGAAGGDIGAVVAGLKKLDITAPADVARALELLTQQGKAGAFTMQNMAREAGPLLASMASMGQKGLPAIAVMGALAQTTQMATDSAAESSTAIQGLIREIAQKGKALEGEGVTVFDPKALAEGREQFLALDTIVKSILKQSGGKLSALSGMFGDEAMKALKVLATEYGQKGGSTATFDQFRNMTGDSGQLQKDAADKATTADAALTSLNATMKRMADQNLAGPIQDLADAVNSLEPEQLNELFDIAGKGVAAAAGIWAVNRAIRTVASGYRGIQALRGATGGKAGDVLNRATAQPVTVTNWPAGFGGGAGAADGMAPGERGRTRRAGRPGGRLGRLGRVGRAAGRLGRLGGYAGRLAGRLGPLAAIMGALDIGSSALAGDGRGTAQAGGRFAGALAGGQLGAMLGTFLGPLGTLAGGAAGATAGAIGGDKLVSAIYDFFTGKTAGDNAAPGNDGMQQALTAHARALDANTQAIKSTKRDREGHAEFGGRAVAGS